MEEPVSPPQVDYRIEPAASIDFPALAEIETEAIQSSPLNSVFFHNWADTKVQAAFFQIQIAKVSATPNVYLLKAVNKTTGAIEGYVMWKVVAGGVADEALPERSPRAPGLPPPPATSVAAQHTYSTSPLPNAQDPEKALNAAFCSVAVRSTDQLREKLYQGRGKCASWAADLNRLFVHPARQGRKIGSLLVRTVFAGAEAQGLDTVFLISVPHPRPFYLKMGFVDRDFWDVDLRPWGPMCGGFGMFRFQGMVWEKEKASVRC